MLQKQPNIIVEKLGFIWYINSMKIIGTENTLIGLTDTENQLVNEVESWLEKNNSDEHEMVRDIFNNLQALGKAVFSYPSVRNTQFLKGIIRDKENLADSLLAFSKYNNLLHIPTKVVAMRGFLVAKHHAFSLLCKLLDEKKEWQTKARQIIFSAVCTLITEAVYFSCLEDAGFSHNTKASLADDLISLWDSGIDLRGIRHLSALSSLWSARDAAHPCFGTMDGNAELLRITMDLDEDWRRFLVEEAGNDETIWALEEFIFGLSWEEIQKVRSKLKNSSVTAIKYDQIPEYLDSKPVYSVATERDPRAFYDFFIERREACILRKKANAEGPCLTLEEIYLKYRIIIESING